MMSRHFTLSSELTGAIAKRLPHAKNQLSAAGSFFNQFVTDIYMYIYIYTQKPLLSGQCRTGGCPDNRICPDIGGPDERGARNSEINLNSSL